jgi:hypothetical protein
MNRYKQRTTPIERVINRQKRLEIIKESINKQMLAPSAEAPPSGFTPEFINLDTNTIKMDVFEDYCNEQREVTSKRRQALAAARNNPKREQLLKKIEDSIQNALRSSDKEIDSESSLISLNGSKETYCSHNELHPHQIMLNLVDKFPVLNLKYVCYGNQYLVTGSIKLSER